MPARWYITTDNLAGVVGTSLEGRRIAVNKPRELIVPVLFGLFFYFCYIYIYLTIYFAIFSRIYILINIYTPTAR